MRFSRDLWSMLVEFRVEVLLFHYHSLGLLGVKKAKTKQKTSIKDEFQYP